MKKTMLMLVLVVTTISAAAQTPFQKGKWLVNPSITGLDLSYSKNTKTHFGLDVEAGAFVVDDFALLVGLGMDLQDNYHNYTVGVGGRYYFSGSGIYVGGGFDVNKRKHINANFNLKAEVGYAYFINKHVTLEPALYYKYNTKDNDFSRYGLKMGLGIYF